MPIRHRGHRHDSVDEVRACEYAASRKTTSRSDGRTVTEGKGVPDGRYTVVLGEHEHVTLRLATQPNDAEFLPGMQLVSYLSGADNDSDYTRFAHLTTKNEVRVWKRFRDNTRLRDAVYVLFKTDQAKAREAYAMTSGNCSRCGRTLTVPASLNMGLGPECAKKVGVTG